MLTRLALGLLALLAACSSDNKAATPLNLTASIQTGGVSTITNGVKANGSSTVTIQIAGATAAPIHVTTGRGHFATGGSGATINATSGSVELVVCDARTDSTCPGNVVISALDANQGYGEITLVFIGVEASCTNGADSNHDGRVGCADPDCDGRGCNVNGTSGTCTAGACVPPICTPTHDTEICDNGIDDDCDNKTDCAAASCDGQACKPGFPTFVCRSQACTDVGSGYAITVTPKRTRIPADGLATDVITAKVTKMAAPQGGVLIDFSADLGDFAGATSATTGSDGTATVTYRSSSTAGTATITAALHDVPQVSQSAFVTLPALGSISIGSIQNQVMGVIHSGVNEQNQISVLLLDTDQKPYPDGLAVRFEHDQLGGSTITMPYADDTDSCQQALGCLAYIGHTASPVDKPDTSGLANVSLASGTAAGPVSITATATGGGTQRTFTVQNIAIVGAKASGAHVSIDCTPKNVEAFSNSNCMNSFLDQTITCTVFLADRFNNVLGVATRADFRTEAGSAGPPVTTKAFDPAGGADQTAQLGHASDSVQVMGYGLPLDVEPNSDENFFVYDSGCGLLKHNPRDGLGTVIVAVQGEEGFVDQNGNGVYDDGEPFVDAGEPFIDENDDGIRQSNEPFIDVNQNGKWDGPNGKWDATTVVWAETRVLYSGSPSGINTWFVAGSSTATPIVPDMFDVHAKPPTSQTIPVFMFDENFNALSPTTRLSSTSGMNVTVSLPTNPPDSLGVFFSQQYCDAPPSDPPPAVAPTCAMTCQWSPCYRVTKVSNYNYGVTGVTITGAMAGADSVTATATLTPLFRSIVISGTIE